MAKMNLLIAFMLPSSQFTKYAYLFLAFGPSEDEVELAQFVFDTNDAVRIQDQYWERLTPEDQRDLSEALQHFAAMDQTPRPSIAYTGDEALMHYQTHFLLMYHQEEAGKEDTEPPTSTPPKKSNLLN